jgi:peroxiredoxin
MRSILIYAFILIHSLSSCDDIKKGKINISGTASNYSDSSMLILTNIDTHEHIDTAYIINNRFNFTAPKSEPTGYGIFFRTENQSRDEFLFFWKENVDISIKGIKGEMKYANVEGGIVQSQQNDYNKIIKPLSMRFDSINAISNACDVTDTEKINSLNLLLDTIIYERVALGVKYVMENPNAFLSASRLLSFTSLLPKGEIKSLYENLSPKIKETPYAKAVSNFLTLNKDVEIGDIAEDFQLPDLNGNKVGLKDFKGKFVLLEFWVSGCGPCRMENKNLLANYKLYNSRGFEIISISNDKNEKDWAYATKKDSIIWASLRGDGEVGAKYNVKFTPSNFLIDPTGKIIAINLMGDKLGVKLKKILPE